jgi:hypothetical protein
MNTGAELISLDTLLCNRGLPKVGILQHFVWAHGVTPAVVGGVPLADRMVRHDDAAIRDAFVRLYAAVEVLDPQAREQEFAHREERIRAIYRLYTAGLKKLPTTLRRPLQQEEVQEFFATIKRIRYTGHAVLETLIADAERCASSDEDMLAHVMDPLQIRYLLSACSPAVQQQLGAERVHALLNACQKADRAEVRAWFAALDPHFEVLSREMPQFLRSAILEMWRDGVRGLGILAFETAVLDVRMFGDLGWENTRLFCSLLRRITAPGSEVLDPFLNDEEIDCALSAAEKLKQDELIAHFRKVASSYDTRLRRDVYRAVMAAARPFDTEPAAENVVPKSKSPFTQSASPIAKPAVIRPKRELSPRFHGLTPQAT